MEDQLFVSIIRIFFFHFPQATPFSELEVYGN